MQSDKNTLDSLPTVGLSRYPCGHRPTEGTNLQEWQHYCAPSREKSAKRPRSPSPERPGELNGRGVKRLKLLDCRTIYCAISSKARERSLNASGKVNAISQIWREHSSSFDLINLSTALHRFAKILKGKEVNANLTATIREMEQVVLKFLRDAVLEVSTAARSASIKPQAIANIPWSFASLKIHSDALMTAIAADVTSRIEGLADFDPQNIANLVWAFAKLDT